jgi:hypothetical protein
MHRKCVGGGVERQDELATTILRTWQKLGLVHFTQMRTRGLKRVWRSGRLHEGALVFSEKKHHASPWLQKDGSDIRRLPPSLNS